MKTTTAINNFILLRDVLILATSKDKLKAKRNFDRYQSALLSRIEAGDRALTKSEERADMIRVLAGLLAMHEQLSDVLIMRIQKALES